MNESSIWLKLLKPGDSVLEICREIWTNFALIHKFGQLFTSAISRRLFCRKRIFHTSEIWNLTLLATIPGGRKKINLHFYFHTSLRSPKRFSEGFKGFPFWGTTKECENENLSVLSEILVAGSVNCKIWNFSC